MSLSSVPPAVQRGKILNQTRYLTWYFAFFVISGFCGLLYEVIWVRLAVSRYGVTTALVSIVLAIFMGGLGLGSWGAGIVARRIAQAEAATGLLLYSLTELLIGLSALSVPIELNLGRKILLHAGIFVAWQTWRYYLLVGCWLVVALLPWCTSLGATFPLLMSAIRKTCPSASDRSFSFLYLANVIGALLGTLTSAFVLIELLGFEGSMRVGAILNVTLALLAVGIGLRLRDGAEKPEDAPRTPGGQVKHLYGLPRPFILVLLFSTGLVSMGSEVVWMRQFTPFLGNFVYAFALILGVYLAATALGARDYRRWARTHHPDETGKTWSIIAVSTVLPVVGANPMLHLTNDGVRILSIFFFCVLTGFMTPLLVDAWSAGEPDKAGLAYAFNILGCIFGPLIASFCLEPSIGERWCLLVLSLPLFLAAAIIAFGRSASQPRTFAQPSDSGKLRIYFAMSALAALVMLSFSDDFETEFPVRQVRRDYAATVIATGTGFHRNLIVNGSGMTEMTPITKFIAHLPMAFMDRTPRNGLVICFGMGTTFRSMLSWGVPTTAVDLIPSVPKLFPYFHSDAQQIMRLPQAKVVVDDGRRFLDGSSQTFDVIVIDPPPPVPAPGSSLLYSREFYEVVKRHLAPDGLVQNWYPSMKGDDATLAAMAKALKQSFPFVRAFRSFDGRFGIHFIASLRPIPSLTGSELAVRMPDAAQKDLIEWGPGKTAATEFDLVLSQEVPVEDLIDRDPEIPVLSDDQPINEYFFLRRNLHIER